MATNDGVTALPSNNGSSEITRVEPTWDIFDIKLGFVSAAPGRTENFNQRLRDELLSDSEFAVVAVLNVGSNIKQHELSDIAVGNLNHWRVEHGKWGNNDWKFTTIFYNINKIKQIPGHNIVNWNRQGNFCYLKANFVTAEGATVGINIAVTHMPHRHVSAEDFRLLRTHWEAERMSHFAVVMGNFNETIEFVRRQGIDGFPAFEPGFLTTGAARETTDKANSFCNRVNSMRSKLEWPGLYHNIGIVQYRFEKMRTE